MAAELERKSFGQVAEQLRELSSYVKHERLTAAAQTFRAFASELEAGCRPARPRQITPASKEAPGAGSPTLRRYAGT